MGIIDTLMEMFDGASSPGSPAPIPVGPDTPVFGSGVDVLNKKVPGPPPPPPLATAGVQGAPGSPSGPAVMPSGMPGAAVAPGAATAGIPGGPGSPSGPGVGDPGNGLQNTAARQALMAILAKVQGGGAPTPETTEVPDSAPQPPMAIARQPGAPGTPSGPGVAPPNQRPSAVSSLVAPITGAASSLASAIGSSPAEAAPMSPFQTTVTPAGGPTTPVGPGTPPGAPPAAPAAVPGGPAPEPGQGMPGLTPVNLQGAPGPANTMLMKLQEAIKNAPDKPPAQLPAVGVPANKPPSASQPAVSPEDVRKMIQEIALGAGAGQDPRSKGGALLKGAQGAAEAEVAQDAAAAKSKQQGFENTLKTNKDRRETTRSASQSVLDTAKTQEAISKAMKNVNPAMTPQQRSQITTALAHYGQMINRDGTMDKKELNAAIEAERRRIMGEPDAGPAAPSSRAPAGPAAPTPPPGPTSKAGPPGSLGPATGYPDGQMATGKNGQKIVVRGGYWMPA